MNKVNTPTRLRAKVAQCVRRGRTTSIQASPIAKFVQSADINQIQERPLVGCAVKAARVNLGAQSVCLAELGSTIHIMGACALIALKVDRRFQVTRLVLLVTRLANPLVSLQGGPRLRLPQAHHANQPHNRHQHQRDSNAFQETIRPNLGSVSHAPKGDIDLLKVLKVRMNVKNVLEAVMGRELGQSWRVTARSVLQVSTVAKRVLYFARNVKVASFQLKRAPQSVSFALWGNLPIVTERYCARIVQRVDTIAEKVASKIMIVKDVLRGAMLLCLALVSASGALLEGCVQTRT